MLSVTDTPISSQLTSTDTAVCVDLANREPKSCAHEYNYVIRLPIQPEKKLAVMSKLGVTCHCA